MKQTALLLLFIAIAFSATAQKLINKVELKYDNNNRAVWWQFDKKEKKLTRLNGFFRIENEEYYTECHFKNGLPQESTMEVFYANGTPLSVIGYDSDGKMNGTSIKYHQNGKMCQRAGWQHGIAHGEHTEWHSNGQMSYSGTIKNNSRNGECTAWREDGQMLSVLNYKDDMQHGLCTFWIYGDNDKPSGMSVVSYKEDMPKDSSLYYIFMPSGKKKLQSRMLYDTNGNLTLSETLIDDTHNRMEYKDGELRLLSAFQDGQLISTAQYANNELHGKSVTYYPSSNKIYRIEHYHQGQRFALATFDMTGEAMTYKLFNEDGTMEVCDKEKYETQINKRKIVMDYQTNSGQ